MMSQIKVFSVSNWRNRNPVPQCVRTQSLWVCACLCVKVCVFCVCVEPWVAKYDSWGLYEAVGVPVMGIWNHEPGWTVHFFNCSDPCNCRVLLLALLKGNYARPVAFSLLLFFSIILPSPWTICICFKQSQREGNLYMHFTMCMSSICDAKQTTGCVCVMVPLRQNVGHVIMQGWFLGHKKYIWK